MYEDYENDFLSDEEFFNEFCSDDELNSSIEALYDYDQLGKYENDECWNGDYYE